MISKIISRLIMNSYAHVYSLENLRKFSNISPSPMNLKL